MIDHEKMRLKMKNGSHRNATQIDLDLDIDTNILNIKCQSMMMAINSLKLWKLDQALSQNLDR